MSQVFTVYRHPKKGFWGFNVSGTNVRTADIKPDGRCKVESVAAARLGPEVAKRMRAGYSKARRDGYLSVMKNEDGQEIGQFVQEHPDLSRADGSTLVLYTPLPATTDLQALCDEWEEALEGVSGYTSKRAACIDALRRSESYLAAFDDHPAMALLLASWAFEQNQELLGSSGRVPEKSPQIASRDWAEFLASRFDEQVVERTMDQLRLSARSVLAMDAPDNLGSINKNETEESHGWMADASRYSF